MLPSNAVNFLEGLWQELTRYHSIRCMDQLIFKMQHVLVQDRFFVWFGFVHILNTVGPQKRNSKIIMFCEAASQRISE